MDVEQESMQTAPGERITQDELRPESTMKESTLPQRRREAQALFPEIFKEIESLEEICEAYADIHDKCDEKEVFSALSQDMFVMARQARMRSWLRMSEKEFASSSAEDAEAWVAARRMGEQFDTGILKLIYAELSPTPARRKEDTGFAVLLVRACPLDGRGHSGVINMAAPPHEIARKAALLK